MKFESKYLIWPRGPTHPKTEYYKIGLPLVHKRGLEMWPSQILWSQTRDVHKSRILVLICDHIWYGRLLRPLFGSNRQQGQNSLVMKKIYLIPIHSDEKTIITIYTSTLQETEDRNYILRNFYFITLELKNYPKSRDLPL